MSAVRQGSTSGRWPYELPVWATYSQAGVGLVCGRAGGQVVGVDIDTDDAEIISAILRVIPLSTVGKRGQKGRTLFYRGPDIAKSRSWNINGKRVCDLIGPGKQTVLPPTVHADTGLPYVWPTDETLEDVTPNELPELTSAHVEAIGEALKPFGYQDELERSPSPDGGESDADSPWRRLNDEAMANLDKWVPALGLYRCRLKKNGYEAVADWRPSNGGNPLEKRKLNLNITRKGIVDFGDTSKGDHGRGYSPIDLVIEARRCDLANAYRWLNEQLNGSIVIDLKPKRSRP